MGLKNISIFSSKPISFTGIKGSQPIIDKQNGGECWIEALENLAQLYIPTHYTTAASARQAIIASIKNPETVESRIRFALVKDLIENNGQAYGYYIEFGYYDNKREFKRTDIIHAGNITSRPEDYKIIIQYSNNARAYYQEIKKPLIVDDNIGEFNYKINLGRALTDAEKLVLPFATACYRVIKNVLGIDVSHYRFDEKTICTALDADRPVLFLMNVSGFKCYNGQSAAHAILIADYIRKGNNIYYVIIDSNYKDTCYVVPSEELLAAARGYVGFGTNFQLFIPDKSTPWNQVMGV